MLKLKAIAGPLRGNVYDLNTGETSIGRVDGNTIVLNSPKVSKKHCLILIEGGAVSVSDAGSSNGTFVNGVLSKSKKLAAGDRISVGEHVLEIQKSVTRAPAPRAAVVPQNIQNNNVLNFPDQSLTGLGGLAAPLPGMATSPASATGIQGAKLPSEEVPKDYVEKVKYYFDKHIVRFLYNLNEKQEWSLITKGLIGILTLFSVGVSVFPTIDRAQDVLMAEARNRARALARLIVDRNTIAVMRRQETDLDISFAEREERVVASYIVDMDNRILAPGKLYNQILSDGQQGRFAENARKFFEKNERYFSMPYWNNDGTLNPTYPILQGNMLGLAEPIKVLDPAQGKNVIVGFAVVFINLEGLLFDFETSLVFLGAALVFAAIMALAIYVALHRLTTRPIQYLNEQLDSVLRGESQSITLPFKMEELNPLVQVLNTAASRMTGGIGASTMGSSGDNPEDLLNLMSFAAQKSSSPMMVLWDDYRLFYINPSMEEITNIRNESSVGQGLQTYCLDGSFTLMLQDLLVRAPAGSKQGVSDNIEFSGDNYSIEAVAIGAPGGSPKGFVVTLTSV